MATYLITGVNRGIGLGLLKQTAQNPENLVIGTVRDARKAAQIEALGFKNVKVIVIDLVLSEEDFKSAFRDLENLTPEGIDIIIHNAGACTDKVIGRGESHPLSDYSSLFDINVIGTVKLYQALYNRLETNGKPVKFAFLSSTAGIITDLTLPCNSYGVSKAALNYFAKQVSVERKDKGDIIFPIHPGYVQTELADDFKDLEGLVLIPVEESVTSILKVVDGATSEYSGKFWSYDGTQLNF